MNTKTIDVWAENDIYENLDEDGFLYDGIGTIAKSNSIPVTVINGHLSESLRWRKVGEEVLDGNQFYVVNGVGVCSVDLDTVDGPYWVIKALDNMMLCEADDTYRPAIPGIDYVEGEV